MQSQEKSSLDWWSIIAGIITFWMIFLDMSGVAVILPTVQKTFHISTTDLQWIVNAYLVALSIVILFGGRLADQFGHKKVFLISLIVFLIGSILCAISPDLPTLLIGRVIQGIGGAVMMPLAPAMVVTHSPPEKQGQSMGITITFASLILASGPFIGGLFTQLLNWRWIFWVNVPACILNFLIIVFFIKADAINKISKSLDWFGFITSGIAIAAFLIAIMQGNNWGWGSPIIIACFVIAVISFCLFLWVEKHSQVPLLDLSLFKNKIFTCICCTYGIVQMLFMTEVFLMVVLQNVYGFGPLIAGIAGLPMVVPYVILAPFIGKLYDKVWARIPISSGLVLVGLSYIWVGIFMSSLNYWWIFPGLLGIGIALPFITSPSMVVGLAVVSEDKRGIASAVINGIRQFGASIGLAVLGAIIVAINSSSIFNFLQQNNLQHVPLKLAKKVLSSPHLISHLNLNHQQQMQLTSVAKHSYAFGTGTVFWIAGVIIMIDLIFVLAVLHKRNI